jgi:hypothetical protein
MNFVSAPFAEKINVLLVGGVEFSSAQLLLGVGIYTALCAIVVPTPSEIPLLLSNVVPIVNLYLAAAIGKGLGSIVLALLSSSFVTYNGYIEEWIRGLKASSKDTWIARNMGGRRKLILYFLCQAIPFAPMRLSTIIYSSQSRILSKMFGEVFVLSAIGTVIRMAIVAFLVHQGYLFLTL